MQSRKGFCTEEKSVKKKKERNIVNFFPFSAHCQYSKKGDMGFKRIENFFGGAASMKYIICEDFSGSAVPFLFPDKVSHCDMREQLPYTVALSCGYVSLQEGEFVCSGGDAELGLAARPEDSQCIAVFFAQSAP